MPANGLDFMRDPESHPYLLVVLDDGETFSGIDGCSIIGVSPEDMLDLQDGRKIHTVRPQFEIALKNVTFCGTPQDS